VISLIDQSLFVLIAILSVGEEWYATYPYRESIAAKGRQSKLYHRYGFFLMIAVGVGLAFLPLALQAPSYTLLDATKLALLNGCIYWNLFDMGYSLLLTKGRTPFYLGEESFLDGVATKLSSSAGKLKCATLSALTVLLNF
jgi:hypothetical protein